MEWLGYVGAWLGCAGIVDAAMAAAVVVVVVWWVVVGEYPASSKGLEWEGGRGRTCADGDAPTLATSTHTYARIIRRTVCSGARGV